MPVPIPSSLGLPVTTRNFSLLDMVSREWGSEFRAPDHGIYQFDGGVRRFDSTDTGITGIYNNNLGTNWSADSTQITADTTYYTADGL